MNSLLNSYKLDSLLSLPVTMKLQPYGTLQIRLLLLNKLVDMVKDLYSFSIYCEAMNI